MTIDRTEDILPQTEWEERPMPTMLDCSNCRKENRYCNADFSLDSIAGEGIEIKGIITCLQDGHQWPIVIDTNTVREMSSALSDIPIRPQVPPGIAEEIQEARRAHFMQCFKASVVMCRRAMQMALIEKGIPDGPLQRMLDDAKVKGILGEDGAYGMAMAVKDYGDKGAHRTESLSYQEVGADTLAATLLVNAVFG